MRSIAAVLFLASLLGASAASLHPDETETFLEANVPYAPMIAQGSDGREYLLYEIHLTYLPVFPTQTDLELKRIDVLDGTPLSSRCYHSFQGNELEQIARRLGDTQTGPPRLSPNKRTIVFAFLPLEKGKTAPTSLRHVIHVEDASSAKKEKKLNAAVMLVKQDAPRVIGPPLKGGGWLAANGPGRSNAHRCAAIPYKGAVHVTQRFAIDWIQIDDRGKTVRPGADPKKNESYYCYGAEAIAVTTGEIVALRDNRPDNSPVGELAPEANLVSGLAGNYAVIDIGKGQYAVYCHIQPGSFRVKKGDQVRRGQVIGLVGNSGNSGEPHLHFQVSTSPDIFAGEGVPYAIDQFKLLAGPEKGDLVFKGIDDPAPVPVDLSGGKEVKNAIPLENDIIGFPSK